MASTLPVYCGPQDGLPAVNDAPANPDLHREKLGSAASMLGAVSEPSYWSGIVPDLHVGDSSFQSRVAATDYSDEVVSNVRTRVVEEGYTVVDAAIAKWQADFAVLRGAIVRLQQHGWDPSFVLVFDEIWALMHNARNLMRAATGNEANMDMLAWHVDPRKGQAGFSPHRDRQPPGDTCAATFRPDGTPRYSTCWIPFTDATPDSSCLYVIPKTVDPGYVAGDPEEEDAPDPLAAALPNKQAYQHVRALPCPAGSAVIFTHRIIHWGSAGTKHAAWPRISFSFGCSDETFEKPYFSRASLPFPTVKQRVALIAAQMLIYHQRFPFDSRSLKFYKAAVDAAGDGLESEYRRKVLREFVAACRELEAMSDHKNADESKGDLPSDVQTRVNSGGEDEDEDALDAMLGAALECHDDLSDDFDDFEGEAGDSNEESSGASDVDPTLASVSETASGCSKRRRLCTSQSN